MDDYAKEQTERLLTNRRCVNLDWLEVHAREPADRPMNADFYRSRGVFVTEREYGTRVYREMFVLDGTDGQPLIEIRRNPASQGVNGIHDATECHIRLVNRGCYFDNAAEAFEKFLKDFGYVEWRISRVDLCLDFTRFDYGDDPQAFVRRYFKHKYAKINQGRISSHGADGWSGQEWNSLSWGSNHSAITTKMYDKTMELYDKKTSTFKKPYIRQAWCIAGLVDDWQHCTKNGVPVKVWRVEFSIRSSVKNWVPIEIDGKQRNYQSIRNTLDCYKGRDRILVMFASLANHYFRFKKYSPLKRKDRCKDKILFDFSGSQVCYKVGRENYAAGNNITFTERYARLIAKIREYQQLHTDLDVKKACDVLITAMNEDDFKADLANPWSQEEIATMKMLVYLRTEDGKLSYEAAMTQIKQILGIGDRTISTF